ncbi:MAG: DUF86 domain-containing protein [Thermoplasmatota archaeon]
MSKNDVVYLHHMLDSMVKIKDFTDNVGESEFENSELIQSAVIRQIEIIGEATKQISQSVKRKYPHIPWRDIAGMRDKLIHGYFGVDIDAVWDTIQLDIPVLEKDIKRILEKEK